MENSPFMFLAAELRNAIFELASTYDEIYFASNVTSNGLKLRSKTPSHRHVLGLNQTCRQIRDETDGLFLALNDFKFKTLHEHKERDLADRLDFALADLIDDSGPRRIFNTINDQLLVPLNLMRAHSEALLPSLTLVTHMFRTAEDPRPHLDLYEGKSVLGAAFEFFVAGKALNVFFEFRVLAEHQSEGSQDETGWEILYINLRDPLASLQEAERNDEKRAFSMLFLIEACRRLVKYCCEKDYARIYGEKPSAFKHHKSPGQANK